MNESEATQSYFDLVESQRAQREVESDPIPEELIEKILRAGPHAPSAMNSQPWRFIVVQDPAVRQEIADGARVA